MLPQNEFLLNKKKTTSIKKKMLAHVFVRVCVCVLSFPLVQLNKNCIEFSYDSIWHIPLSLSVCSINCNDVCLTFAPKSTFIFTAIVIYAVLCLVFIFLCFIYEIYRASSFIPGRRRLLCAVCFINILCM